MSTVRVPTFDHALQVANIWVHDVARAFDTEDRQFAYRVLRAWLHVLRDRLTVEAAAHFAAQLPELLRGVFYEGWNPNAVPEKYDAETYTTRFAQDATISKHDVRRAAAAVTSVALRHLAPGQVDKALEQLPADIRTIVRSE